MDETNWTTAFSLFREANNIAQRASMHIQLELSIHVAIWDIEYADCCVRLDMLIVSAARLTRVENGFD